MENASKALIIAGSILLSILIIALGMYIFSQSSGSSNTEKLDEMAIKTFNANFDKYSDRQSGSNVIALIDTLISNVNGKKQRSEVPIVSFADQGASAPTTVAGAGDKVDTNLYKSSLKELKAKIETSHNYYVYQATNNDTDLVHAIIITYEKQAKGQSEAEKLAGNSAPSSTTNTTVNP